MANGNRSALVVEILRYVWACIKHVVFLLITLLVFSKVEGTFQTLTFCSLLLIYMKVRDVETGTGFLFMTMISALGDDMHALGEHLGVPVSDEQKESYRETKAQAAIAARSVTVHTVIRYVFSVVLFLVVVWQGARVLS
jgi:hypothetical protein